MDADEPNAYDPEKHCLVKPVIPRDYSGEWQCKCGVNLGYRSRSFNNRYKAHLNSEKLKAFNEIPRIPGDTESDGKGLF